MPMSKICAPACAHDSDHLFQIGASLGYWQAAQAVIGTELENDERGIMQLQRTGQSLQLRRPWSRHSRWR